MRIQLLVFSLITVQTVAAQAPVYKPSEDPLRYRESTRMQNMISSPQGEIPIHSSHEATLSLVFTAEDSARASYDALALSLESPQGTMTPDTAPVLGEPFVLYFAPTGGIETVSTPTFPDDIRGITDLQWQFFDFFLPLPGQPLEQGLVWTDTLRTGEGGSRQFTKAGRYEVTGDTVIAGMQAVIVTSEIVTEIKASGPGPSPGVTVHSTIQGTEQGALYFSPDRGVFLGRTRTGTSAGDIQYEGGPQPISLELHQSYESTIEWIEGP
jgi:hypothetical protein